MWWALVLYQIVSYSSCFLSLVFNAYLIYLIRSRTSTAMKPYSKILLQSAFTDIVTSVGFTILQLEMESFQTVVFARGGPLWFGVTNPLKCSAVAFGGILAILCYWSTPLQSLYRYFFLCKKKLLSIYTTMIIQIVVVATSISVSIGYFFEYHPISENPEKLQLLLSLAIWKNELHVNENFCYANVKRLNVAIFCIAIITLIFIGFVVLVFTSWRIYVFLESSKSYMSPKTRIIHKEINQKILYQTVLPCTAAILIVVIVSLAYFMESYQGGLYIFLFYPYCLNSFINPLITIFCVHRYRQATAYLLYRKKVVQSSNNATVTRRNTLKGQPSLSNRASLTTTKYYKTKNYPRWIENKESYYCKK